MKALLHPHTQSALDAIARRRAGSYIFHGATNMGKATAALELVRAINCQGDTPEPCRSCRQITAGAYPDLFIVQPEDKPSILIEQVRSLIQSLSLTPYRADGVRGILIDQAHTLTDQAQNALLKLIEEPPPQTLFILVTSRVESLLPTVRSRCAAIYFSPVPEVAIAKLLTATHNLKPVDAAALAATADGAPGTAVRLATNPEAAAGRVELHRLATAATAGNLFDRLLLAKRLTDTKADLNRFGGIIQTRLLADLNSGASTAAATNRQLAALETFRQQLQAKVAPRVAVERLLVEL